MSAQAQTPPGDLPLVSVVIEGYNQSRDLGAADATITALMAQDYPKERMELVLVGSQPQIDDWRARHANGGEFRDMKFVAFDQMRYYEFKNAGAAAATGEIVALTDSDVLPRSHWVSAIVENINGGADASVGPTLFGTAARFDPDSVLMRMAAAITWGWILGKRDPETGRPRARGFMDHNIAMRAEIWRDFQYRTDLGRIIASPLLFRRLDQAGKRVRVHPRQQAVHHFSWKYWLICLEYRYGHEVYRLRRLDKDYPQRWIASMGVFEPVISYFWHVMLDAPKWFRFNRVLGTNPLSTAICFPPFIMLSAIVHLFEMAGAFSTILAPKRMQRWAENV